MVRTNKSVVTLYQMGVWAPVYTTTDSTAGSWARLLKVGLFEIGKTNRITLTYIYKKAGAILSSGYVYFDYTQTLSLDNPPSIVLTHVHTDGDPTLTEWLVSVPVLTINKNESELWVQTSTGGAIIEYTVEADDLEQIETVYDNVVYSHSPVFQNEVNQTLLFNEVWRYNDNNDIYNTNVTGRVGINTGSSIDTNAMLDVNGNVTLRGLLSFQYPGSDIVFMDSASDLGYDFRVYNATDNKARLYIDDVGQLGINTNVPANRLHVVGNTQITERISIGAGNTPLAKTHIIGESDTHATSSLIIENSANHEMMRIYDDCVITFCGVPLEEIIDNNSFDCDDLLFKDLPIPVISNTWAITQFDGSPYPLGGGTSTDNHVIVAAGALVDFSGTFSYIVVEANNQVEPEWITGDWGPDIPGSGIPSAVLEEFDLTVPTVYEVNLHKLKTGLIIVGDQVICPDGEEDMTSAFASLSFGASYYFGYIANEFPTQPQVQSLLRDDQYLTSRTLTVVDVDPIGEEYTIYAYPVAYGPLVDIIVNGAPVMLGSFNLQGPMDLINHAGVSVSCHVYVSNAMDAFTNDLVKFL